MTDENFGKKIKLYLLSHSVKPICCRTSFITGTEVFGKKRKNELTDAVEEYKSKLLSKRSRMLIEDERQCGYLPAEENGEKFPVSSGRVCPSCFSMLLRGAFLVCGRASSGAGGLHLEIPMPGDAAKTMVTENLSKVGIELKTAIRRKEKLLYCKKRETISDFLAYIGAAALSFELINNGIMNETRAEANRQKNCDTQNIQKTVVAAERQLMAVKALKEHGQLEKLPAGLYETAVIRMENPIEPLDVITELHGGRLTKSGVNHRLGKIVEIAENKGYIKKRRQNNR